MAYLLHCLLCHKQKWSWDDKFAGAFAATKQALVSSDVWIHYDPIYLSRLQVMLLHKDLGLSSHTLPMELSKFLPHEDCYQLKEIMLNWRRRQHLYFLESVNSTSISMAASLP